MRRTTMLLAGCLLAGAGGCGEVKGSEADAMPMPVPDAVPAVEQCNGLDDNGDGHVDERWAGSFTQGFLDRLSGWAEVPSEELARDSAGNAIPQVFAPSKPGVTSVVDGVLYLDDAATTISRSTVKTETGGSWIYDLDVDRGNQLFRPAAIGTGDFELTVEFTMESAADEAMLAGVALTGAAMTGTKLEHNVIEAFVGAYDPTVRLETIGGTARAWIRQAGNRPGQSLQLSSAATPRASYRVRMSRVGKDLTIVAREAAGDGAIDPAAAPVFQQTVVMEHAIERIALVGVRLNTATFGSLRVRDLALCWGPAR